MTRTRTVVRWAPTGLLGALAAVLALLGACRDEPPLTGARSLLRVSQEVVAFQASYPGVTREVELRVVNAGRTTLDVEWTALAPPFFADRLPTRMVPGEVPVRLRYRPEATGAAEATLTGRAPGGGEVRVVLQGQANAIPTCPTPVACHTATFDVVTEACVEALQPDGTACDPGNACLQDATCAAGRCRGTERVCDDGDACTTDVCNPLDGCASVPAPPCPGDGRCQVGTCDPKVGCGLAKAPDGTFCGPERGCDVADVCLDGACQRRDPPDNFTCAPASPCQGPGRCKGSVCERPAATALFADWTYDAASNGEALHDLLVGPTGDVTLVGFFMPALMDAAGPVPVRASVAGRRCMLWNDRLLCMDLPLSGQVSLLDRATGAPRWTFDLATARPDFAKGLTTLFMARLGVMQPDRLAALFEAYPEGTGRDTLCRRYFLVVLDAFGGMVSAQEVKDPLLSECNHPHPYGVASDAAGDLYLAFGQTQNVGAPLYPGAPTLLMAFSQDGVPRWRKTEAFSAGELAIVNGLLLNERSTQALRTQDGQAVGSQTFPNKLGRVVATSERLIPSPSQDDSKQSWRLEGYGLPGLEPAWTYTFQGWPGPVAPELRLASWTTRPGLPPETVVLGTGLNGFGLPTMFAVSAKDGAEVFHCPVSNATTPAQFLELGPDSVVMMDGAQTCGDCDPPFANSQARFRRFPIPGLKPAEEPWPGTFGGPGHDHHEDPVRGR
ncbi:tenascin-X [Corallococcus sp. BB11-1]|uniref:tenascin-X n=1 Tax=Corallococcus sp. BB11-1 TaxID=2996783 RepID=UPI00226D5ECF|nr:tenascin-X [Corallococcus sp. BB11-1]MCY1029916.1 tenascin-X [Corallococcus sp. BB11-1]